MEASTVLIAVAKELAAQAKSSLPVSRFFVNGTKTACISGKHCSTARLFSASTISGKGLAAGRRRTKEVIGNH